MTRKSITTNPAVVTCDVCGRTLLRGENADVFIAGGQRRNVCELCTGRAVHEGWIREGLDDVVARGRDGRGRRGGSLLSRLRSRREPATGQRELAPEELPYARSGGRVERLPNDDEYAPLPPEPAELEYEPEPEPVQRYEPEPAPVAAAGEPLDHTLYESRSVHGVPTNADLKVVRAMELFNQSPQVRTVAGVARSLGAPIVSARPSRTEGSVVTIVVAWELSWYRFEVDLGNEAAGVRVTAQGSELSELDTIDQTPNAAADDGGRLHPAASLA
ncbi:hypothetical protein DSM104299_02495 [Baekduia alba]|uniref:hypothetical protein n=1 Tax=Baekduia alba TaxID=2997333 RepID=UPI002342301C|nr:hypothetical protein [Baekduia alba]WCB93779.1 hypothetical protein DSM104299_02495 [Baekduia alba]